MNTENITGINEEINEENNVERRKKIEKLRALAIERAENEQIARAIAELSEEQILMILGDGIEEETTESTDDNSIADSEPVYEESVQEEPAQEMPAQEELAQELPIQEDNVQEISTQEESAQEEIVQEETSQEVSISEGDVLPNEEVSAENDKAGFLATHSKALFIAAAVVVVGLCVTVAVMAVSYSKQIDELNKKISKQSKTIVSLQSENDKLKTRTEELKATIQKAKKKKEAARKKAKAKSNRDLAEAQKNTSAIAIYSTGDTGVLTKSKGVVYYKGHKETYYSSRVLRHKDIGSWSVDAKGVYRDSDGYVCVASNSSDLSAGKLVLTSMGIARVHDSGCAKGTIDIYVNW